MISLGIPNEVFPAGNSLFGLFAVLPACLALRDSRSYASAGILGGLIVFLVHLMSSFWLAHFEDFAIFTLGASALAYFILGIPVGMALRHATRMSPAIRPFAFAAVWTLWEWVKSIGFLAYPWGTLVMTSRDLLPLIQIADLTGMWGIGFLLALLPAALGEFLVPAASPGRNPGRAYPGPGVRLPRNTRTARGFSRLAPGTPGAALLVTLILYGLAFSYGLVRLADPPVAQTSLDMILVQQNADPWIDDGYKSTILASQNLTREALSSGAPSADLVVWSESILNKPFRENRKLYRRVPDGDPFLDFMAEIQTPLLVGSPVLVDSEARDYSNSVILVSPEGHQLDWYGKIQLVCFAEYMPFTEYKWVREMFDSLVGFSKGWIPGKELKTMSVTNREGREIRFATPICFEDAFPTLCADLHKTGSDILVNLTNDAWSRTNSAEMQHFAVASFRAIELRTTLVRSTNAGYTVVLDPLGKILRDIPLFTADWLRMDVPVYPRVETLYARFGDWFPFLLFIAVIACFIREARLDRRRSRLYVSTGRYP